MTPVPAPAPGDDGDRDAENPDIETPVPVNEPVWQDANYFTEVLATLTPDEYRRMLLSNFDAGLEAARQNDLAAYHSHLCECPTCAEADNQRQSRIQEFVRKTIQW